MKKRIAVFIGGRSPEHDVSVVTGLQAFQALDRAKFDPFLVYVSLTGEWFVGSALEDRANYIPTPETRRMLTRVSLDSNADPMGRGHLIPEKKGLFGRAVPIDFDAALLAFHGLFGEDGGFQGMLESANVPYTGMRTMASAVLMDKAATKRVLAGTNVPQLPFAVIERPYDGMHVDAGAVAAQLGNIAFPVIVKPAHLGSSIGVGRATSAEEVAAMLPAIFALDHQAMVEPFVENLVEYNVAVSAVFGDLRTSAIERPKRASDLLDFKQKYMSGGGTKKAGGQKTPGQSSEGMLSLTRDINPDLPPGMAEKIRGWAEAVFRAVGGSGAPRLDFLSNEKTGEVWFNEANPCPGSLGFFLWEAAEKPVLYTAFLSALIAEAFALHARAQLPADPTLRDARLFARPFNC
ncbi:MAG: D-alanine--D-alanine ligase [Rhodospirillales bacterium]|nr:D-alanine--D-alanine ligase [Alphaproteobacteria bacterium]MCB9986992.1 D-alanine--D-alanine ligase [Rhodospirillales bacterium]USO08234.1 MAG: D-alanine--D-alanine ligase [Rhodospirillales bacterium]